MIKSDIQTLINTNLANTSNITASEHRAVEDSLLNAFYPTIINVDKTDSSILTFNSAFEGIVDYSLNICKIGRLVTITGVIYRMSGSSTDWFFSITNSEYYGVNNTYLGASAFVAENLITNENSTLCRLLADNKCMVQMTNGHIRVHLQYFAQS